MNKLWFLLLLLLALPLNGQDFSRRTFYGKGETREIALEALFRDISPDVQLKSPGLLQSYSNYISQSAVETSGNGNFELMLKGTALDAIFQSRRSRAQSIMNEGRKASDDSIRMTYYRWAWYYISSLPAEYELSGKGDIEKWIQSHQDIKPGKLPVPMTHIEREVEKIRSILGEIGFQKNISPEKDAVRSSKTAKEKGKTEPLVQEEHHRSDPILSFTDSPEYFSPTISFLKKTSDIPIGRSFHQYPEPSGVVPLRISLLASIGLSPETVYGSTLSIRRKWGIIADYHTNFKSVDPAYSAQSNGKRLNGDTFLWPNGNTTIKHFQLSAGLSRQIQPWMDAFFMTGYGERTVYWQDMEDNWAMISDLTSRGLALSTGILLGHGHFSGILEAKTISFQTWGMSIGLGYTF